MSNSSQYGYGQLKKQRWEGSEKGREERKSKKKEDANARQGRTVVKRCVFLMFCGPWGPATAAGAKIAQRCGVKHVSKSNC